MQPFIHYSFPHIIAIILTLFSCYLSVKIVETKNQASKLRYILIVALIIKTLWYHSWQIFAEHNLTLERHLPLQISQISIILMIIALAIEKKSLYQFIYYWAGWSSLLALLFPQVYDNFPHPSFLIFFLGYLLLLNSISYIYFIAKIRMTYRYLWITAGALVLYCAVVYPLNLILGTNFAFLVEEPQVGGLVEILPAPPWHILFLALVVLLLLHLQYLLGAWRWGRKHR